VQNTRHEIELLMGLGDKASGLINRFTNAGEAVPTPVSGLIASQAQARGFSDQQLQFAQRLVAQESGGNQYDKLGNVLTSSAGARGIFQLMPGTAAGLGVNADIQSENIKGGLDYIAQLWAKYGGDPQLVAMAYNWGPGNVDKLLSGIKTTANIPAETQNYLQAVTGSRYAGPQVSGGLPAADIARLQGNVDVGLRGSQDTFTQQYAAQSRAVEVLEKQLTDLDKLYESGAKTPQEYAAAHSQLTDELLKQVTALNDMRAPVDQFIHGMQQQGQALSSEIGAAKEWTAQQAQLAQAAEKSGKALTGERS
jgi:hypothetical protein